MIARARNLSNQLKPSGLLAVDEARRRIVEGLTPLEAEAVGLSGAVGRVLADDVVATVSHPPMPVSAMDGYACRWADVGSLPVRLRLIGTSKAGLPFRGELLPGTSVRIFTGAAVPPGADVIALQEDAKETDGAVEVIEAPKQAQFIRPAGQDFKAGQRCVERGRILTARDLGVIASCGHGRVSVRRKPRIAILSTGDELVAPGTIPPASDRIVASNGVALSATVAAWGGDPLDLGIVPDDVGAIAASLDMAAPFDLLVTTGGASVGDHDLVQAALLERGFVCDFWKIAMRPGKPLMFGRVGRLPVLTMPGNPVSALVCAVLFLRPAMFAMLGLPDTAIRFEQARLATDMGANDLREDYVRARLEVQTDGRILAAPFPKQDSGMALALARSDGLIRRMPFAPAAQKGDFVEVVNLKHLGGF